MNGNNCDPDKIREAVKLIVGGGVTELRRLTPTRRPIDIAGRYRGTSTTRMIWPMPLARSAKQKESTSSLTR